MHSNLSAGTKYLINPLSIKGFILLFLALCFGLIFIYLPWEEISGTAKFADIDNYLISIHQSINDESSDNSNLSILQIILNEPLWGLLLVLIGNTFDDPATGLKIISFFCVSVYFLYIFSNVKHWYFFIFLFNPLIIDLIMSQTRSALAVSICFCALMLRVNWLKVLLIILAICTHSVTLILLSVYFFSHKLSKQFFFSHPKFNCFFAIFLGLLIAIGLSYGREFIFGAIGDRRAEYDVDSNSLLYISYWMILAVSLQYSIWNLTPQSRWYSYFTTIIFSLAFFMTIFGANAIRFVPLAIPILLVSISNQQFLWRQILVTSLGLYQIIQFFYWW